MGLSHVAGGEEPEVGKKIVAALASLPKNATELETIELLRRQLAPAEARVAAKLFHLRRRAEAQHGETWLHYWNQKGSEQATAPAVARARAREVLERLGPCSVLDACCGLGSDSVALALAGHAVLSAERTWSTLRLAALNLAARELPARVLQMDACLPAARTDLLFLDPDRRPEGVRTLDPARWSPSLAECLRVAKGYSGAILKLAPALKIEGYLAQLPGAHPVWVSKNGELAELTLWLGRMGAAMEPGERGVRLVRGSLCHAWQARPRELAPLAPGELGALGFFADPDPAVVNAGLLGALAAEVGMQPIAPQCAFLGGFSGRPHPFLRLRRVLGVSRLDPRHVRALLGQHGIGPLTVRKRGHPLPAEELARRLRGPGTAPGELAVARLERGHLAFLLAPADEEGPGLVGDEGFEPPTSSL